MTAYGLQLYSIRDLAEKDLTEAIRTAARIGYKGIEFAGFFGLPAQTVRDTMVEAGVTAWGTHTSVEELTEEHLEETIAYHQAISCKLIIIPGAELYTLAHLEGFARVVNAALPRLTEAGITLAYHNHSHEFFPNDDGIVIYDWLLEHTSLKLEVDTFWAFNAGKEPIALLDQLGDRVVAVHLKDGIPSAEWQHATGTPLGQGKAPVRAVRDYALAHGQLVVVESETLQPDGPTEAAKCMAYLKMLEQ